MFSHDFFQAQTFKFVVIDIFLGCFSAGNLAIFINVVESISFLESVDVSVIVVGLNHGGFGSFFNFGNFCSGSFGFTGCSISFACCSFGFD